MSQSVPNTATAATAAHNSAQQVPGPLPPEFYWAFAKWANFTYAESLPEDMKAILQSMLATCRGMRDAVAGVFGTKIDLQLPLDQHDTERQQLATRLARANNVFTTVVLNFMPHSEDPGEPDEPPELMLSEDESDEQSDSSFPEHPAVTLADWRPVRQLLATAAAQSRARTGLEAVRLVDIKDLPIPSLVPGWLSRLCPSLKTLALSGCSISPDSCHQLGPPVTHPTLSHIKLQLPADLPAQALQQQLSALPHLKTLTLRHSTGPAPPALLSSQLCLPAITQLQFFTQDQDVDAYIHPALLFARFPHLVSQFPNVKHLSVKSLSDPDMQLLLTKPWPNMKRLQVGKLTLSESYHDAVWPFRDLSFTYLDVAAFAQLPLDQIPTGNVCNPGACNPGVSEPHCEVLTILPTSDSAADVARVRDALQRWANAGCFCYVDRLLLASLDVVNALSGPTAMGAGRSSNPAATLAALPLVPTVPGITRVDFLGVAVTGAFFKGLCATLPPKVSSVNFDICSGFEVKGTVVDLLANLPRTVTHLEFMCDPRHRFRDDDLLAACRAARWPVRVEVVDDQDSGAPQMVKKLKRALARVPGNKVTLVFRELGAPR